MSLQNIKTQESIRYLLSACANAALYGMEHPQVTRLCDQTFALLDEALSGAGADGLLLMVIENELVLNGEPLQSTLFLNRFAEILGSRSIGHVRILPGVNRAEVGGMIAALSSTGENGTRPERNDHISYGTVEVSQDNDREQGEDDLSRQEWIRTQLQDLTRDEIEQFREIYEYVRRKQKMKISGVARIVTSFIDSFRSRGEAPMMRAASRETDDCSFTHSTNVCILNLAQAMALGITGQALQDIGIAAMLHDIGKMFLPEEILTKPGELTDSEIALVREHPVKGARFLLEQHGVPRLAIINAYEHHMRWDLGGYPAASPSWQLNLCSHLTMISDYFDTLRTRTPQREALQLSDIEDRIGELTGTAFHPALAGNFLRILARLRN